MAQDIKATEASDALAPQKLTLRHILVVVAGVIICFAPSALTFNTWSIFVVPVSTALNVDSSAFAIMPSIIYLGAGIFSAFAGNLMEKYDLRIVMSASVIAIGVGMILSSFYTEIWQFYLSGLLEGIGVVSLICLGPATLVNRWYNKHIGLLVGICVACAGLGGATWSMVDGFILNNFDYHMAYLVNGIASLALGLPATLFCVRSHPYQVGLRPYGDVPQGAGADDGNMQWGVAAKIAFALPAFYLTAIAIGLVNGTAAAAGNMLPTYLYHLSDIGAAGLTAAVVIMMASVVASIVQISQMLAKIYLGIIADRKILAAWIVSCSASILGIILCWQGGLVDSNLFLAGSFFVGILYGTTNVLGPTLTRYVFGQREYTKIYSRITIVVNLIPAVFITLFAKLSEISWDLMFSTTIAMVVLIFVMVVTVLRMSKNIEQTLEPRVE